MKVKDCFIYIWFDKKRKMYYVGSHFKGHENDGYICSSNRMRDAYRRRPNDFKRKILQRLHCDYKTLLEQETKWLKLAEKRKDKYYNLHFSTHHWATIEQQRLSTGQKISLAKKGKKQTPLHIANVVKSKLGKPVSLETRIKISSSQKGRKLTGTRLEFVKNLRKGSVLTQEHKNKISLKLKNVPLTEQTKQKLRKPKPKIQCNVCHKIGGISSMKRWHFENCKRHEQC